MTGQKIVVSEWTYNRAYYVINRREWLTHYMILCNQEINNKKRNKNGRNS
jgi:hypothetical protein